MSKHLLGGCADRRSPPAPRHAPPALQQGQAAQESHGITQPIEVVSLVQAPQPVEDLRGAAGGGGGGGGVSLGCTSGMCSAAAAV